MKIVLSLYGDAPKIWGVIEFLEKSHIQFHLSNASKKKRAARNKKRGGVIPRGRSGLKKYIAERLDVPFPYHLSRIRKIFTSECVGDVAKKLGVAIPTCYRYARELGITVRLQDKSNAPRLKLTLFQLRSRLGKAMRIKAPYKLLQLQESLNRCSIDEIGRGAGLNPNTIRTWARSLGLRSFENPPSNKK